MTPKITVSKKALTTLGSKYCVVTITEETSGKHRFIEDATRGLRLTFGVGKWEDVTLRQFQTIIRSIIQSAKHHQLEYLALDPYAAQFPQLSTYSDTHLASFVIENIILAHYEFTTYKSKKKEYQGIKEIVLIGDGKAITDGIKRGTVVGTLTNAARDIANTQGDDLTPKVLADKAKSLAKGTGVSVSVLGRKDIIKQKLNLINAVGKGSHNEEQLIVMEYWGAGKGTKTKKAEQPIILIGKGITYDTGGLNVKPAGYMHDMHMDMSGGSSVMATIVAASKLGIKKNIIALIPAAENAISSTSMRAGDIVTSHSGTTVEILHTDAEGRLVLADALSYCQKYNPRVIVDVATLTGAALVALGQHASAVLTTDTALATTLTHHGEMSGEYVWPLPLWDEYKQHLKSSRADVANIASNFSKFGGCIEGGSFLAHFAPKGVPWAHLDIAPRMDSIPSDKLAKGSTGEPVRLLVSFIEQY